MKRILSIVLILLLVFAGCDAVLDDGNASEVSQASENENKPDESKETSIESSSGDESSREESSLPDESEPDVSQNESQDEPQPPKVEHSNLYIEGVSVEQVILWFNEVVLDAEFMNGGDATLVQKWTTPIRYFIEGETTDTDIAVFESFTNQLNQIEGFPGIVKAENPVIANMNIYFCLASEFQSHTGQDMGYVDGAVRFWYRDNAIYNATVCYRTEINQITRNSVIIEEIYNGLGPVQDTNLRTDSIIYSGYSEPQQPTAVDWLILKLLYHPDIKCGMNAQQCESVIRRLYY